MKKKKGKKPKDNLIESILEDLKDTPDSVVDIVVGPDGIRDSEKSEADLTHLLGSEEPGEEGNPLLADVRSAMSKVRDHSQEANLKPIDETVALKKEEASSSERTMILGAEESSEELKVSDAESSQDEPDKTRVATPQRRTSQPKAEAKISYGGGRGKSSPFEAQFAQAEHLKIAQQKILDLEKEVESLRKENEVLSSAAEISRQKIEDLVTQVYQIDKQKHELRETNESELRIFKDALAAKDSEIIRLKSKVEELESRLSNDLRKVRVRERELENRLELAKAEKAALLRAKDETILELKRQAENFQSEIESYQSRILELSQKIESNQDQFARTVRALRLALTNLEVSDGTSPSITLAPLKKAE